MYVTKKLALMLSLAFILSSNVYTQIGENTDKKTVLPNIFAEYIFSPALGFGMNFDLGNFKEIKPEIFSFGPALKFDMLFLAKSGFTFIILNDVGFPIIYNICEKKMDIKESGYPVWNYGVLFGYTYGVKTNLEITTSIGFGAFFILPEIIAQLNISNFFTEKYGVYFSYNNKFIFLPKTLSSDKKTYYTYAFDVSAGAAFRIFPKAKERSKIGRKKLKKHNPLFEQYVFIPEFTLSSLFLGISPDSTQGLGPSIGLDMIFTKMKSGFSFFMHTTSSLWFLLPKYIENYKTVKDAQLLFIPVTAFHFMFGYTYGRGKDFEISAGLGPAIGCVPLPNCIGLSAELAITKYFSKKYGITFSALNSFTFIPFGTYYDAETGKRKNGFLFADMFNLNIGTAFRL